MEKLRHPVLSRPDEYGFGLEAMKRIKVCRSCGSTEPADNYLCSKCRNRLSPQTFFQIYQRMHRVCKVCDTVLAPYMHYCPHCGVQIKHE